VWVWGFWFGFALRRVALLCGVFVQLHLALFPAGGPFLSSLSVNPSSKAVFQPDSDPLGDLVVPDDLMRSQDVWLCTLAKHA
jgi:hypothetical protein